MRFRRPYTLYRRTTVNGKRIWYYRIYANNRRIAKSTGCTSKERAMMYVDSVLRSTDKIVRVFSSNMGGDVAVRFECLDKPISFQEKSKTLLFKDYAKPWWMWDTCRYVLDKRAAGTKRKPGIKQSYL